MTSYRYLAALCLVAALSSCTSDPSRRNQNTTFSPTSDQVVSTKETILVAAGFRYVATAGPFAVEQEIRLAPGVYTAELRDSEGTYFRGPKGAVYKRGPLMGGDARPETLDGGLWLPNVATKPGAVYFYLGSEVDADSGNSLAGRTPGWLQGKITFGFEAGPKDWAALMKLVKRT